MESTDARWTQYWNEYNSLVSDLRAAGEIEWADALETRMTGGATGSEVVAIVLDTLQRLRRTEIAERLQLQDRIAGIAKCLGTLGHVHVQVRLPHREIEESGPRVRDISELYRMSNALIADLTSAGEEQLAFYLRYAMGKSSGQQILWELSGYLLQMKRQGIAQHLGWRERIDAMLDYIALPLDANSRVIPSSRIPRPTELPT
jgi:hypothetical protein